MTHTHGHEHGDHDGQFSWGHHDARYNAAEIIKNLILIQEHYTKDPCADCLSKHHNLVQAYAEEGMTLDNVDNVRDLLEETLELSQRHLQVILECAVNNVCRVKTPEDMMRMIQEIRALRRKVNARIYGLDGDVTHDILAHHDHGRAVMHE